MKIYKTIPKRLNDLEKITDPPGQPMTWAELINADYNPPGWEKFIKDRMEVTKDNDNEK